MYRGEGDATTGSDRPGVGGPPGVGTVVLHRGRVHSPPGGRPSFLRPPPPHDNPLPDKDSGGGSPSYDPPPIVLHLSNDLMKIVIFKNDIITIVR
ncbi:Hypothetical protein NTJ_06663 [Nesidiocoris tenuis]|nr:Hypothetical protein NTJ_06663 [Nesidiocoris tenuis]